MKVSIIDALMIGTPYTWLRVLLIASAMAAGCRSVELGDAEVGEGLDAEADSANLELDSGLDFSSADRISSDEPDSNSDQSPTDETADDSSDDSAEDIAPADALPNDFTQTDVERDDVVHAEDQTMGPDGDGSGGYVVRIVGPGQATVTSDDSTFTCEHTCDVAACETVCHMPERTSSVVLNAQTADWMAPLIWPSNLPLCLGRPQCTVSVERLEEGLLLSVKQRGNLAFVSPNSVSAASVTTPEQMDNQCQTWATQSGLPGGPWVAWVSFSDSRAGSRFGEDVDGWVRIDGLPFAEGLTGTTPTIYYPLTLASSLNEVEDQPVLTGTAANGLPSSDNCDDWTKNADASFMAGRSGMSQDAWTALERIDCSSGGYVYCLQNLHNIDVSPDPPFGRRLIFVSEPWDPSTGLEGADGICNDDASNAGFSGEFIAMLYPGSGTPIDRLGSLTDEALYRPDGVQVIEDFDSGERLATPNQRWDLSYSRDLIWVGTGANSCEVWSTNAAEAQGR
ncbi:MAG: hypothetical protein KC561_15645, partial [Myxococcales bacterium]|nr:hypothetical protein [Myxococcales bacterium]